MEKHSKGATRRAPRAGARIPRGDTDSGIDELIAELDRALRMQARLWNELAEGKFELLFHRKPTQRDLEMGVRLLMKDHALPEILRWKIARLVGGPISHES